MASQKVISSRVILLLEPDHGLVDGRIPDDVQAKRLAFKDLGEEGISDRDKLDVYIQYRVGSAYHSPGLVKEELARTIGTLHVGAMWPTEQDIYVRPTGEKRAAA